MSKKNDGYEINQDGGFDDSDQSGSYDELQDSPADVGQTGGEAANTAAQKLRITVRPGKAGFEATVVNMPEVKKKTSKIGLEEAAIALVKSMNLDWSDFKDVTSYRDQDAGRKVYEYQGDGF